MGGGAIQLIIISKNYEEIRQRLATMIVGNTILYGKRLLFRPRISKTNEKRTKSGELILRFFIQDLLQLPFLLPFLHGLRLYQREEYRCVPAA